MLTVDEIVQAVTSFSQASLFKGIQSRQGSMTRCSRVRCKRTAKVSCRDCADAPGYVASTKLVQRTVYCSENCLKADRDAHETLCSKLQLRRRLCRAAEFLKELWHTFRGVAFDYKIAKIDPRQELGYQKGALHLREGAVNQRRDRLTWPFNNSLTTNPDLKAATLDYMQCTNSIGYLKDIIGDLLSGEHPIHRKSQETYVPIDLCHNTQQDVNEIEFESTSHARRIDLDSPLPVEYRSASKSAPSIWYSKFD